MAYNPRPASRRRIPHEYVPWKKAPLSMTNCLRANERFPGKGFAEKGARWLNMGLPSNYPPERRKQFAKKCFLEAVSRCNKASIRAKNSRKPAKSKQLAEIASWLEAQYLNTL